MRIRNSVPTAFVVTAVALSVAAAPVRAQASWDLYQVGAAPTGERPVLDGQLDDPAWRNASTIEDFIQQEPNEGAPASERTEVRLLYDAENLYIAVRAYESTPNAVSATEMRRDSERILQEDNFQIILDTFKDSRSGYMFATNALGAKLDQQVFNEGEGGIRGFGTSSNINRDWDGIWYVSASRLRDGWVAEIQIPMVTLRFPSSDQQSWGLNLMRNISRKNEQVFWAPVDRAYTLTKVSSAGTLNGMQSLNRGLDLRFTPFATSGASRVLDTGVTTDDLEGDVGLDVRYGITASLNLDLTLNTDFAQAEVDDEQVNLTRFPLFFPEKRDFFLENAGQFNVGSAAGFRRIADLFFSRRIGLSATGDAVPIRGGARLTGRIGRNDIAVMNVQTGDAFGQNGENFLVSRYSRNFSSRSRFGALFIDKNEVGGAGYNRTYAADVSYVPHPAFTVTGFLARTETPGMSGDDSGSYLNATWLDDRWRIYGEFFDFEDNFNPEVGFLPRRGVQTSKLHFERNPRPDWLGIRQLSPMVSYTYTADQQGRKVTTRWHFMNGTRFDNGAFLNVWYNYHFERLDQPFMLGGVAIPVGQYSFGEWLFSFNSNPARRFYYTLAYAPQDFFDGSRTDTRGSVGFRVNDRLSTEVSYARNDVDLAAGSFDVNLGSLRVDFALSPTMTLRSVTQYNSQSDQFGTSARFRWEYMPGSDLFITYDEVHRDPNDPTGLLEYRDRRLLIKATYLVSR